MEIKDLIRSHRDSILGHYLFTDENDLINFCTEVCKLQQKADAEIARKYTDGIETIPEKIENSKPII